MCQSHTGRLTGLWFLPKPAFGLNTTTNNNNNRIGSNVWFGSQDTEQKRWKNLTSKGKENEEKNIWPSKRKWRMDDLQQSRVDGSAYRIRYCLRIQKSKSARVRTRGNGTRRKKCEQSV